MVNSREFDSILHKYDQGLGSGEGQMMGFILPLTGPEDIISRLEPLQRFLSLRYHPL
jgi:hypothetical protein